MENGDVMCIAGDGKELFVRMGIDSPGGLRDLEDKWISLEIITGEVDGDIASIVGPNDDFFASELSNVHVIDDMRQIISLGNVSPYLIDFNVSWQLGFSFVYLRDS